MYTKDNITKLLKGNQNKRLYIIFKDNTNQDGEYIKHDKKRLFIKSKNNKISIPIDNIKKRIIGSNNNKKIHS